ncbi:hypothetical protein AMATHDRAFT_7627 [Amanita thiersii Skay4041]|uniref:Hypervirulence associated protein TUDOR domain-containing protein n=1 Tax=Amanita thiersii Skay4041 TaxID=703135 RepID=A0A2A9N7S3_9AGAR|nr:hypothetical protein AMATHDRAFT_7627 [Amanita thiersii Skay4041]
MSEYKVGDRVKYHGIGTASAATQTSVTTGEIVEIITESQQVGETQQKVKASDSEPRYLIRNDNTKKETAYKADVIVGMAD